MLLALKIGCGLYAALMALMGVRWWFTFSEMSAEQAIAVTSNLGVNNLTADLGALFFGTAILIALGLRGGRSYWLLSAAVLMLVAAAGRVYSYATIGFEPATVVPLAFEVASAALLWFTHSRLSAAS